MIRILASIFLWIVGTVSIAYAIYATNFTLSSSVEREAIANGKITYNEYFFRYLMGPEIPGISMMFYFGVLIVVFGVIVFFKGKPTK